MATAEKSKVRHCEPHRVSAQQRGCTVVGFHISRVSYRPTRHCCSEDTYVYLCVPRSLDSLVWPTIYVIVVCYISRYRGGCQSVVYYFVLRVVRVSWHKRHVFHCTTDVQRTAGTCMPVPSNTLPRTCLCASPVCPRLFLVSEDLLAKLDENRRVVENAEPSGRYK